jgi:hypothetical protein
MADEIIDFDAAFDAVGVVMGEPVVPTGSRLESVIDDVLDRVNEIKERQNVADAEASFMYDEIMAETPEIKRVAYLRAKAKAAALVEERADAIATLKGLVAQAGRSFSKGYVTATWKKGRKAADIKMLEGMAALHPELNACFKYGEPSISVTVKGD